MFAQRLGTEIAHTQRSELDPLQIFRTYRPSYGSLRKSSNAQVDVLVEDGIDSALLVY